MSEQERDKIVEASWMRFRDHQSKWFKAPPGASVTRNLFCEIIRDAITQAVDLAKTAFVKQFTEEQDHSLRLACENLKLTQGQLRKDKENMALLHYRQLTQERDQLRNELAACKEDSRRLDWLEANGELEHLYEEGRPEKSVPVIRVPAMTFDFEGEDHHGTTKEATIRSAIDQARHKPTPGSAPV